MARTTIPAELVAVNAIQGTLIADNSVTAVHIATNAISGTLVADNSITSTHIAQNQVTATQIAQNTITVGQLADSSVETAKINNDAVTQAKIADDAVGPDQLAANSVVSASIANGTIIEADMADNAVTLAKMASLARGSIIVGDSAGDPAALSIGSNGTALVSDGTDISWGSAGETNRLPLAGGTMTGDLILKSDGGDDVINVVHSGNTVKIVSIGQSSDNSGNGVLQLRRNNGVVHSQIHSHGSTYFNGGNVGIGFASGTPDSLLHVDSSFSGTLVTLHQTAGSTSDDRGLDVETSSTGTTVQRWLNSGSELMRVQGNGKVGIGTDSANEPLTIRSSDENINCTLLEIGNNLHATNTKDAWMKFVCGAAQNDNSWAIGAYPGSFRFNYLGARATAVTTASAEKMRLEADGVSIGDTDGDFENRNGSEGLHVKRGGILMSGHPGDANMSSDTNGNQWTYHGQGGRGGSFTSVYFSIPNPNNGASGVGYGGFSVEFYIAGYNGKHHSGHYSGYVNGGITQAGAGFYSSSGSASLSAASVGVQGFKITVSFPSMTHPTAKFVVNKGGHGGSAGNAAWTDMSGTQIGWA